MHECTLSAIRNSFHEVAMSKERMHARSLLVGLVRKVLVRTFDITAIRDPAGDGRMHESDGRLVRESALPKLASMLLTSAIVVGACDQDPWQFNCEDGGRSAFVIAKLFVEDRIPSSFAAEFAKIVDPGVSEFRDQADPPETCMWTVMSYVDVQSGSGSVSRMHYIAKIRYSTRTDSWRLEELDIEEVPYF